MKEKQVYKKIWPLPVKNFKKFFLWHQSVHLMNLTVDRQVCVIKTVAVRLRTDTDTDRQKFNKAIAMMRRKSPRSENIYLIENHCQANISK